MSDKKATIAIVTGAKEGGKTFTAKEIVSMHPRILVVDPHGSEFDLPGRVTVRNAAELGKAIQANKANPTFLIVYSPEFDVGAASETIAGLAFASGRCLVVFDEAHGYMSASKIGPHLGRLVRQARHSEVNVVLCSPRLADISTDVRTQADCLIVCGPLWVARDLDALEENTSTEFRRAAQEPMKRGEYRRIGFDTRAREQFNVTRQELRGLFRQ